MYSFIKGTIDSLYNDELIIDCHDVGYRIFIPSSIIPYLPDAGEEVKLFTYLSVKEDSLHLFGFLNIEDRDIFKMLINVNGIGPKGALNILNVLTPIELKKAIITNDDKAISKAQGIGKKMAEKLIIELKDKISVSENDLLEGIEKTSITLDDKANEALDALVSLGYSAKESKNAILSIGDISNLNSEEILKEALKRIF